MPFEFSAVMEAARLTILAPREAARRIIAMQLSVSTGWLGMGLAVVLSTLLTVVSAKVSPFEAEPGLTQLTDSPLLLAIMLALLLMMALALIMGIGRAMGGQGQFVDALVLLAWLEAVLLLLQAAQIVFLLIFPLVAILLGLFSFVVFLWVLANFIAELHRFASAPKVLGMILLTFFAMSFVLALLGLGVPTGANPNV